VQKKKPLLLRGVESKWTRDYGWTSIVGLSIILIFMKDKKNTSAPMDAVHFTGSRAWISSSLVWRILKETRL